MIYCQCEYLKASFSEMSVLPFIIMIIKVIICVYIYEDKCNIHVCLGRGAPNGF